MEAWAIVHAFRNDDAGGPYGLTPREEGYLVRRIARALSERDDFYGRTAEQWAEESRIEWLRANTSEAQLREREAELGRYMMANNTLSAAASRLQTTLNEREREVRDTTTALAAAYHELERTDQVRADLAEHEAELRAAITFLFTPGPGIAVPEPYPEKEEYEPHKKTWNLKLARLRAALTPPQPARLHIHAGDGNCDCHYRPQPAPEEQPDGR